MAKEKTAESKPEKKEKMVEERVVEGKTVEDKPEKKEKAVKEKPLVEKPIGDKPTGKEKTVEEKPAKEEKTVEEKPAIEKKEETTSAKKKIRKMSLKDVEDKLKSVETMMGGVDSIYAQHLLKRKKELTKR